MHMLSQYSICMRAYLSVREISKRSHPSPLVWNRRIDDDTTRLRPVLMLRAVSDRHPYVRLHIWSEKEEIRLQGEMRPAISWFPEHVQVPIISTSNVNQRTRARRSHLLPFDGI